MQAAATGRLSGAERSHPTSEVRGRSQEVHMHEGQRPRGVTPRPRSGAAAKSTRLRRHRNGREELPRVRGQGRQPGGDTPRPKPEARGDGREELPHAPKPEAKGGGGEEQPHIQGAVAARAQEGLEELSHIGRVAVRRYPSSKVRSNGYALLEQP